MLEILNNNNNNLVIKIVRLIWIFNTLKQIKIKVKILKN
jgi:hypothetical protein